VSLPQFLLLTANVYFFLGLGLFVQVRQGWIFALSSAGAMLVLAGAWYVKVPADGMIAALFPGLVAVGYLIGASVCFIRSGDRPDFFGKGVTMSLIALVGLAAAACAVWLDWPVVLGP
jgi:hypothetical protein